MIKIINNDRYIQLHLFNKKLVSFSKTRDYITPHFCWLVKILGLFRKDKKYYSEFIPLGCNCEFGINAFKYHKTFESSLLLWSGVFDNDLLLELIKEPDLILADDCHVYKENAMWLCPKYNVNFHSKNLPPHFYTNGVWDENKEQKDKEEVVSRIKYLTDKFKKQIKSEKKKLFVIKTEMQKLDNSTSYMEKLVETLKTVSTNFDLHIIVEKEFYTDELKEFEQKYSNVYIRTLKKFSHYATANKPLVAIGWTNIFNEFKPIQKPQQKRKKLKCDL